jgi:hypothetical protein
MVHSAQNSKLENPAQRLAKENTVRKTELVEARVEGFIARRTTECKSLRLNFADDFLGVKAAHIAGF